MILFGKSYDENSARAKKGMTGAWQNRHNLTKSYDKQFGKSYDVNLVNNTQVSPTPFILVRNSFYQNSI